MSIVTTALSLTNPLNWFGGYRAKLSGGSYPGQRDGIYPESNAADIRVTAESAMRHDVYWACVKIIAQTMGTLPVYLYNLSADGSRKIAQNDPLSDLLSFAPNEENTATEFYEAIGACLAIWGNFYAAKQYGGGGIIGLQILYPHNMRVYRRLDRSIVYNYTDPFTKGAKDYERVDIFHVKGFGMGDIQGLSPLQFGRETLGRAIAANDAAGSMFKNGMQTPGFFKYVGAANGGVLKPEQLDQARARVGEMRGAANAGTPGIMPASFDWVQMGVNPKDAELMASRRMSAEEICRLFGVPPSLVGHALEGQTMFGSGVEHLNRAFMTTGLRPYLHRTEAAIGRDIIGRAKWRTLRAAFDVEELLRGDAKGQSDIDLQEANAGIRLRNEIRARRGLPPIEGGDVATVNSALIPLADVGTLAKLPKDKPVTPGGDVGDAEPGAQTAAGSPGGDPTGPHNGKLPAPSLGGSKGRLNHAFSWEAKDVSAYEPETDISGVTDDDLRGLFAPDLLSGVI